MPKWFSPISPHRSPYIRFWAGSLSGQLGWSNLLSPTAFSGNPFPGKWFPEKNVGENRFDHPNRPKRNPAQNANLEFQDWKFVGFVLEFIGFVLVFFGIRWTSFRYLYQNNGLLKNVCARHTIQIISLKAPGNYSASIRTYNLSICLCERPKHNISMISRFSKVVGTFICGFESARPPWK